MIYSTINTLFMLFIFWQLIFIIDRFYHQPEKPVNAQLVYK